MNLIIVGTATRIKGLADSERSTLAELRLAIHFTRSHCRAYTINCFVFPKDTNTSSGTARNEATWRTGSWTKKPFLPTKSGLFHTNVRLRLLRSPNANRLPIAVYTGDQLQAQRSVTNMGSLYLYLLPIVRYNIMDEDTGFFSEKLKPDNAVLNAVTERTSLANF